MPETVARRGRPQGSKDKTPRTRAGKPQNRTKPARPQRPQMRAFDDEWALIKEFERVVKKGGPAALEAARDFLARWRA